MASLIARTFDEPDETRTPDKTKLDIITVGGSKVARMTAQPGWRWSACVGTLVGSDTCHGRHFGTVLAGRLHVAHQDGTDVEFGPGDIYLIEPGHDGWVVSDEPYVALEFDPATVDGFSRLPAS